MSRTDEPNQPSPRQVEVILRQVDALPTLSPVAARLLSMGASEDVDVDEVVRLLESDPALTATVLGLCRRADRGLGDRIDTVKHAVVLLGLETVRSAALGVHVIELMRGPDAPRPEAEAGVDRAGLWRHAVGVACCAEMLAARTPDAGIRPEAAFVAGLLHDLGRIVLDAVLPRAYARVLTLAERRGRDAAPVEREILGLDHHEAGRRLADRWSLPRALGEVMWLHSQPLDALPEACARPLIALVTLAKCICRAQHLGWSGDFADPLPPGPFAEAIGADAHAGPGFLRELADRVAERCDLLGLDRTTGPDVLLDALQTANARLAELNGRLRTEAETAGHAARVLEAVQSFCAGRNAAGGLDGVIARIVASARETLAADECAIALRAADGGPWMLWRAEAPPEPLDDPPGDDPHPLLAALNPGTSAALRATWAFDWLAPCIPECDPRGLYILPIAGGREPPQAVLVHDGDPRRPRRRSADAGLPWRPGALAPLTGAWAAALDAAARHEDAVVLGEQLAARSRQLAEAQARLTERESMARLGEMSAGAAHEMNNPLTIIRGRAQLLATRLANAQDRADAAAVAEAAERLAELITSMHLLASPPTPATGPVALPDLLAEATKIARGRLRPPGTPAPPTRVEVAERTPALIADRALLAQAIAEVLVNAFEANLAAKSSEPVRVAAEHDERSGCVRIAVLDRGRGLSPRAQRHAFDPFFSEKPAGRQTGLGLARARAFVDLHEGSVSLAPREGGGTCAAISIPLPRLREVPTSTPRARAA